MVSSIILNSSNQFDSFSVLKKYSYKAKVIPAGLDDRFLSLSETKPQKNTLLFVGSLRSSHWHKGLDVLFGALKLLLSTTKDIKLLVVFIKFSTHLL